MTKLISGINEFGIVCNLYKYKFFIILVLVQTMYIIFSGYGFCDQSVNIITVFKNVYLGYDLLLAYAFRRIYHVPI